MKIRFIASVSTLLVASFLNLTACVKSDSKQSSFRREKGALWWKEVETVLSLPAAVSPEELKNFDFTASDAQGKPGSIPSFMRSCWYHSFGKEDVKTGEDYIQRIATTKSDAYSQKPVELNFLVEQMQKNPKLQPVLLEWTAAATAEVKKEERRQGIKMNGIAVGALTGLAIGVFACSAAAVGFIGALVLPCGYTAFAAMAPMLAAGPTLGAAAVGALAPIGAATGTVIAGSAGTIAVTAAAAGAGVGGIVSAMSGRSSGDAAPGKQNSPFLAGLNEQVSRLVTVNAEQMRLLLPLTIGKDTAASGERTSNVDTACPAPDEFKRLAKE